MTIIRQYFVQKTYIVKEKLTKRNDLRKTKRRTFV